MLSFFNAAQACQTKMLKFYQEFKTIEDTETSYGITYFDDVSSQIVGDETVTWGDSTLCNCELWQVVQRAKNAAIDLSIVCAD